MFFTVLVDKVANYNDLVLSTALLILLLLASPLLRLNQTDTSFLVALS